MQKQVDKSHYNFATYMTKQRWFSVWHQLDEVIARNPGTVLEIGPGTGIFKAVATMFGLNVQTLDLDPELHPDYVASATAIPLAEKSIDVCCAFQVLEHMPFDVSMVALKEMCRVTKKAVIISLPDVETSWASTITIPKLGMIPFVLHRPWFKPQPHEFDGEHYWELNKRGYLLGKVIDKIRGVAPSFTLKTYRVHENQYHRFFTLERNQTIR